MKINCTISAIIRLLFAAGLSILFSTPSNSQIVPIGTGTAISVFSPLNRTNDYCVYEVIYLAQEISLAGNITSLGFQRHDGTNTDSIENVSIYLKHTSLTELMAANYDTSGYTLVYSGSFPNTTGAGWREVALTNPFNYDGINNLQVLVSKGYQAAIANTPVTPRWIYTNVSPQPDRARRYYDDIAFNSTTSLTPTPYTCNAQLTFGTTGVVEIIPGNISVFPNPASDIVHFRMESVNKERLFQFTNTLGQVIYSETIMNKEDISVSDLKGGIYFYSLIEDKTVVASGKFFVIP